MACTTTESCATALTLNPIPCTWIPRPRPEGCTVTLPDNALTEPADESHALWFRKLFSKTEYTVKMQDSYSEDALVSLIAAYDWGNVPPTDAKVVQNEDGSFTIQPIARMPTPDQRAVVS